MKEVKTNPSSLRYVLENQGAKRWNLDIDGKGTILP